MELKLNQEQIAFMSFLIEERRSQIRAIQPLWDRHHRQDAKRIMDGFPYSKGELIPYVRKNSEGGLLLWEASTHNDLVIDLRDHLAERQRADKDANGSIAVIHEILKKVEAMTENANAEMKQE